MLPFVVFVDNVAFAVGGGSFIVLFRQCFSVDMAIWISGEDVKAFGAGVLSSFGEMEWACSSSPSQVAGTETGRQQNEFHGWVDFFVYV